MHFAAHGAADLFDRALFVVEAPAQAVLRVAGGLSGGVDDLFGDARANDDGIGSGAAALVENDRDGDVARVGERAAFLHRAVVTVGQNAAIEV